MKIWVVCQYYPPEVGAPSARISGLAKSWKEQGADVTVLTGIPNHPDGIVPEAYRNRPAFYEEMMDGIRVWRHWLVVAANKGKLRRVINQLSFMASVLFANISGIAPGQRPDVVVASSPAFFCVVAGWLLARRYRARFVFEVRDLWPAIFVQMGILKPGLILTVLEALEMFLYRRADAIVTVTRSFAAEIAGRGIVREKIGVIFNGVSDADYARAIEPRRQGGAGTLREKVGVGPLTKIVLYIGNHGEAQGLTQVIDAARLLVRRTDLVFVMVGEGADKQRLVQYAKGVPNVQFLPGVKHAEVWSCYAGADINLVCLKNIADFDMFIPSKMFEIMASESCAVAALRGEGAALMRESGSALVVPSEDPEALAAAIETLADDPDRREKMGAAGRAYVAKHFLHSRLAADYLVLLKKLCGRA